MSLKLILYRSQFEYIIFYVNILSVYGVFSDRVGLPLHNIPSPFLLFSRSQVLPYPLLHSLTMSFLASNWPSAFNSKLHTFLHPTILTLPHHMSIPSQSTTSNNSYDRLQLQPIFSIIHLSFCLSFNHLYHCSFKL